MENDLLQYIDVSLIFMVAVVYCIGMFLKNSKLIKDNLIPIILLGVSVTLTIAYMAFNQSQGINASVIINGLIQGVLVASVAVYGNQIIKQIGRD